MRKRKYVKEEGMEGEDVRQEESRTGRRGKKHKGRRKRMRSCTTARGGCKERRKELRSRGREMRDGIRLKTMVRGRVGFPAGVRQGGREEGREYKWKEETNV